MTVTTHSNTPPLLMHHLVYPNNNKPSMRHPLINPPPSIPSTDLALCRRERSSAEQNLHSVWHFGIYVTRNDTGNTISQAPFTFLLTHVLLHFLSHTLSQTLSNPPLHCILSPSHLHPLNLSLPYSTPPPPPSTLLTLSHPLLSHLHHSSPLYPPSTR